jgi:hypothetical protein
MQTCDKMHKKKIHEQPPAFKVMDNSSQNHPVPLPVTTVQFNGMESEKQVPPKIQLAVEAEKRQTGTAVVLKLDIPTYNPDAHERISEYELFGYRESDAENMNSDAWKFVRIKLK